MDTITYDTLLSSTKLAFSSIRKELKKSSFSTYFVTLLEDCSTCLYQSLDLITELLLDPDLETNKLKDYLNNAVSILQLLSDLIKNIIESVSMSCHTMKMFPTAIGHIISKVFMHCKDSESLYGSNLNSVEGQLKDLFRTCHELQLTYLMVLEKHFTFDLTERQQLDILIEALDINLKIGELVQGLDVKTMAEQWKAYTALCEKYSSHLLDKDVCCDCTKILCAMLTSHIRAALEENEDSKLILRSLKVGSFMLKILLRVYNIFKHAVRREHEQVIQLLLYIFMNSDTYLEVVGEKSSQFVTLFSNHITAPALGLLAELSMDENFLNCILTYNVEKIMKDDELLGYIIVIISITKMMLQQSEMQDVKRKIIGCLYRFLPHCHVWFNMGLEFKSGPNHTQGLYEHLLTHVTALVVTIDSEGIHLLEKSMVETILSTDCYSSMFSSNLWTLLARIFSRQLLFSQVSSLIKMYQKLESNPLFTISPQHVHLTYTIKRLFEALTNEDKTKLYNMFRVQEERNIGIWTVLGLSRLPKDLHESIEQFVVEKLRIFRKITSSENVDVDEMNKIVNLTPAIWNASNRDHEIEELVTKTWMKACSMNSKLSTDTLNKATVRYYKLIKGLVSITNCIKELYNGDNFLKIIHVILNIIQSGSTEFKLLLISPLCKLTTLVTTSNQSVVEQILTKTFEELFHDTDILVKYKLFYELRKYRSNVLYSMMDGIHGLPEETWEDFKTDGILKDSTNLKQHLLSTLEFEYNHKCLENGDEIISLDSGSDIAVVAKVNSNSSNFDFVDLDTLFDTDTDSEPVSKKAKFQSDDVVDEIVSRLESDSHSLSRIKGHVFTAEYRKRIQKICNKLLNLAEV